jgi:hypothetical protein
MVPTTKEIKQIQDQRLRPLTANDDAIEGLENCLLESISIQEEYEQLKKATDKVLSSEIPFKK